MKVLIIACLLVVAVNASLLEEEGEKFQAFKLKHSKTYRNQAEETLRFKTFIENLRSIEEHNVLYEQGLVSYKKGINKFADMTGEELRAFLTLRSSHKLHLDATKHVITGLAIPDSVDWRSEGYVTEVKDQGLCGACWAFSITGSTEAAYKRKSGSLVSFSEQQLVDCTTDVNEGCNGGGLEETLPYIQQYGIEAESSYPYVSQDGECKYSASEVVTKISGYKVLGVGDEDALLDAVANVGPVSVAMDVSNDFFFYKSGIFKSDSCSSDPDQLNHGVLFVGYGAENGTKYWIAKNSWGPGFGEEGFFRILRGENECGVADDTVYPYIN